MPPVGRNPNEPTPDSTWLQSALGVVGLIAIFVNLFALQPLQFNVVSYRAERFVLPTHWPSTILALAATAIIVARAFGSVPRNHGPFSVRRAFTVLVPLILSAPLAVFAFVKVTPTVNHGMLVPSLPFLFALLLIVGSGWSIYRSGCTIRTTGRPTASAVEKPSLSAPASTSDHSQLNFLAPASIILMVLVFTVLHTRIQINFFDHFMLGHADFGHYTEEFKNALAGRGLRSDSFPNTRLGWHFSPLLYLMVPGYWLWPSPVYLMVCSALFVHLPAIPAYFFAKRQSGSLFVGWLFAVAWLLLPSCSRLIYSNTYGFQWIYAMMAPLGIMVAAGVSGRWRTCLIMIVVILLAKETTAAIIFGWGMYVTVFTRRRVLGASIVALSVAYALACIYWIIPHFAASGRYERMELFGSLGGSFTELAASAFTQPGEFFSRLFRPQAAYFLLILLVPMAGLSLKGWRIALATVPSLLLILLMENPEWLSIKFWHQATVLPVLFFAGIATLTPHRVPFKMRGVPSSPLTKGGFRGVHASMGEPLQSETPPDADRSRITSIALAAVVCAAWSHYFFGFSPFAKAYAVYANNPSLHMPDPRLETVRRLRAAIAKDRTILATERLAAHFTDYRRLYTGKRPLPADFVLIDRDDSWDSSGLPQRWDEFAHDTDYQTFGEFGPIIVFELRLDAPRLGIEP